MKNNRLHKQIPKNLFINIFSFISSVVIGIWLTPYLLEHLGIVAYGFIPLAMFFSQYVSVIMNSINISINRFLLVALQNKEDRKANSIFNTSLVVIAFFTIIQALIMFVIIFDLKSFFDIPYELITDTTWLFSLTFIGFSISLFRSVFGTSLFSYNRLDILRSIDIVQSVVRVLVIIILFSYDEPSLKYIGYANLIAAISAIFPTLYYFRIYTPQLKIDILLFDKKHISELSKMSVWILINQVGVLLLGNINLYMVNNLMGVQATGEYAIIIQINSLFRTLLTLFAGIFTPVIMTYFANKEFDKLKTFILLSTKIMIVGLVLPLAVLIGLSESLIDLWLGEKYKYLHMLMSASLLFFIFVIPVAPLFSANIAYNKVKLPALVAVILGVLNIVGIYVLITQTDLELWGVIIVKLLLEVFFVYFIVVYVAKVLSIDTWQLMKMPFISLLAFIVILCIVIMVRQWIYLESIEGILLFIGILSLIVLPSMILGIFRREERILLFKRYINNPSSIFEKLFL